MTDDHTIQNSDTTQPPPVPPGRTWGFWTTLMWIVFILLGTVVVDATVVQIFRFEYDDMSDGTRASVSGCIYNLATVAFVVALVRLRRGWRTRDYLALVPAPLWSIVFWTIAIALFGVLYDLLMSSLGRPIIPEENKILYATASNKTLFFLLIVIAAPVGEEVLFRGFAFRGWSRTRLGVVGTVIATAIFFGALHLQYDIFGIVGAGVIGLLLGVARAQTGSLYPCIAMHMANNLIAYIQTANAVANDYIVI